MNVLAINLVDRLLEDGAQQEFDARQYLQKYGAFFGNLFTDDQASQFLDACTKAGATKLTVLGEVRTARPAPWKMPAYVSDDELIAYAPADKLLAVTQAAAEVLGVHLGYDWQDILGDCAAWYEDAKGKSLPSTWRTFGVKPPPEKAASIHFWFD